MARPPHVSELLRWDDSLRQKRPQTGLDLQDRAGHTDPRKVTAELRSRDIAIRSNFNSMKLIAVFCYHDGCGFPADGGDYTVYHLEEWLEQHGYRIDYHRLRKMIIIAESTYWWSKETQIWIDGFPASTQFEIAGHILRILKKNPVLMTPDEAEEARPIVDEIRAAVPRGTPFASVLDCLQRANLLPRKGGGGLGGLGGGDNDDDGLREKVLALLRKNKGWFFDIYFGRTMKAADRHEHHLDHLAQQIIDNDPTGQTTPDQAISMLVEAGAKVLGVAGE